MKTLVENRQIRSCLFLVHLLQRHGKLSLRQINEYWRSETSISGGAALSPRTFYYYRNTILDMLGVAIECHKPTNTYYIIAKDENELSAWLISSFNVGQLVMDSEAVRDRILLEPAPRGMKHFSLVVEAFRKNLCLQMRYQKFDGAEPYDCHIQPCCMKLYQQRWYLLGVKDHGTHAVTFALDRIRQLELLEEPIEQEVSQRVDGQTYYRDCFGVWSGEGEVPTIRLRVYGKERQYVQSLPLHHSQRKVTEDADWTDFTLQCYPTRDLMLHLLSHGRGVEVLEPDSLRQAMAEEVRGMQALYAENG